MKKLFLPVFVFLSFYSFGQKLDYSLELSYNHPYITPIKNTLPTAQYISGFTTLTTNMGIKENYTSKPGAKLSTSFSYKISDKLHVESGLTLSLIRFKQSTLISNDGLQEITIGTLIDEGTSVGIIYGDPFTRDSTGTLIISGTESSVYDDLGKTNILYTEIPLKIGYAFFNNKLFCKVGLSAAFLSYSEIYKYNSSYFEISNVIVKDNSSDGLSNIIWSGNIELEYLAYKNIGLNLSYSRSFNSIYDENLSIGKPKFNVFSLGLSYHFSH